MSTALIEQSLLWEQSAPFAVPCDGARNVESAPAVIAMGQIATLRLRFRSRASFENVMPDGVSEAASWRFELRDKPGAGYTVLYATNAVSVSEKHIDINATGTFTNELKDALGERGVGDFHAVLSGYNSDMDRVATVIFRLRIANTTDDEATPESADSLTKRVAEIEVEIADLQERVESLENNKQVVEFASVSAFPETGREGTIYVAKDTNKTYRWTGSQYIAIGGGDPPVTSVNNKTGAVVLTVSDVGAYAKPSGGIPASDMSSSVQTSLGKADTAAQSATTYTKAEVDAIVQAIKNGSRVVVQTLPDTGDPLVIYMVPKTTAQTNNVYDEYIWLVSESWEKIGDTTINLSGKADKVANATSGNFAGLDATGNLTDSGKKASDFAAAQHVHEGVESQNGKTKLYATNDGKAKIQAEVAGLGNAIVSFPDGFSIGFNDETYTAPSGGETIEFYGPITSGEYKFWVPAAYKDEPSFDPSAQQAWCLIAANSETYPSRLMFGTGPVYDISNWASANPSLTLNTGTASGGNPAMVRSGTVTVTKDVATTDQIPAAQVNADWNADSGVAQILNKPTIPDVSGKADSTSLAPAFSASSTYAVGDYVTHEGLLYKCTTAVSTAGAWDAANWTAVAVTDEMGGGAAYYEVEYLESTGTQYIDTGIVAGLGVRVVADLEWTALSTNATAFGSTWDGGSPNTDRFFLNVSSSSAVYLSVGANGSYYNPLTSALAISTGVRHVYDFTVSASAASLVIDGTSALAQSGTFTFSRQYNIFAFARNNRGGASDYSSIRLYSLKIYSGETLVRDFVPVRSGFDFCLFDKVSRTFFINKGTGVFRGGQDVNPPVPTESPAFTGTPTAPTAAAGTNTTQIATTAFVQTAVSGKLDANERNLLPYASTTTLAPETAVYRSSLNADGTFPTITDTGIPTAAAYYQFELELAVPSTVPSTIYGPTMGGAAFDSTASYAVGAYVVYDNVEYVCVTAHTGAWDASHFKQAWVFLDGHGLPDPADLSGGETICISVRLDCTARTFLASVWRVA